MLLITSSRNEAFNEMIENANKQLLKDYEVFVSTPENEQPAYHKACCSCLNSLAYVCGLYKSVIDSSPASIRITLEEYNTSIKQIIVAIVSTFKDTDLSSTLFEDTFHSEEETYVQFLDYSARFSNGGSTFFRKLFGVADTLILQFATAYITGIKVLCALNGTTFENVPSEENLICKNWKYFFSDAVTFSISGTFIIPQNALTQVGNALKEDLNADVYKKLHSRSIEDFTKKLDVITFNFSS